MLPDLTPATARAVQAAQQWAQRQGATDVQPAHLLCGLLEEEEGRAAGLLASAGLDPVAARRLFADRAVTALVPSTDTPLPLSPPARTVLQAARELSTERLGERTVASESLLLALLHEDPGLRHDLEALGLDFARLEGTLGTVPGAPLPLDEPLHLTEPTEEIDRARILDASANRAREGLRVVEDYCRFVLDDAFLSSELKRLRHDLTEAVAQLSPTLLLEARETQRDVGTALTTAREQERHSLLEVAQANLKRLQEALRSLEEFGKLCGRELGQRLEKLRYRSYTVERAIVLGTTARQRLAETRLYVLVTGSLCATALEWMLEEAVAGGAQILQLREKALSDRALLERARKMRHWTHKAGVLFLVNDRPDVARLVEADGVHLGQDDFPVKEARRILGPDALVGVSTHNLDQVRQAVLDGASYIGVGPTFPSGTKEFAEFPGLEFVRQVAAETSLPAFVLGGVNLTTLDAAVAAGARRIAVSQAICQAEHPRAVAQALWRKLGNA